MPENIKLIPFLEQVMEQTTKHYKSDIQYDFMRLREAINEPDMEDRTFYWMARPNGTWLVRERDAFLRDSDGYLIWTHYAQDPAGIKAYRVVVTGGQGNIPLGTAFPIHYAEQVKRVEQRALPVVKLELTFCSDEKMDLTPEQYKKEREWIFGEYGMTRHIRYCPESEDELARILLLERRYQKGWRPRQKKRPPDREGR